MEQKEESFEALKQDMGQLTKDAGEMRMSIAMLDVQLNYLQGTQFQCHGFTICTVPNQLNCMQ